MIKDVVSLVEKVTNEIKNFTDIAIVGMSGGADSTLVSILCRLALGKENVYGIHMPYGSIDHEKFNANSVKIADMLGVKQITFDIGEAMDAFADNIEVSLRIDNCGLSQLNEGNARSRMRMMALYTINQQISESRKGRCRVMGTGNLSEDFIGYDTKGGDALADIFPIGQLFKSEYFVEQGFITSDMIDRNPSAGLWDGQTDEGELGYTYNEMEPAVAFCIKNYDIMEAHIMSNSVQLTPLIRFVWDRHIANKHKHEGPAVVELGDFRE